MEYRIRKSSDRCSRCERPFTAGESYYSLLRLEEDEPARSDCCEACFDTAQPEPPGDVAFWRTRRIHGEARPRPVDFNMLRDIFFRMVHHTGEEYIKISYLLALVLVRKRVLQLQEFTTQDGRDYLVVTAKGLEQPLKLEAPALLAEEVGDLREKLKQLLDIDADTEGVGSTGPAAESAAGSADPAE